MKIRVVLMTENDKPLLEGCSKEDFEFATKILWEYFINQTIVSSSNGDKGYVESVELVEE